MTTTAAAASLTPEALPAVTVPVLLEGRLELRKRLQRGIAPEVLINPELDSPLARLDLDRYDLLVEQPRLNCHLRPAMGLERELVLRVARDAVRLGDVLGRHPHMDLMERIGEAPDHRIDERRIAHPRAPAGVLYPVGAPAHRLSPTSQHDLRIAGLNCLGGRDDRLDTAATQAVDGKAGASLGIPALMPTTRAIYMSLGEVWITLPNTT
jgi:hypothetical protein